MSPFSTSDLSVIASLILILSGVFTALVKILNDTRKDLAASRLDLKELNTKVMDQAIPALEKNAAATVAMTDATSKALQLVAVAESRSDRTRPSR